MRDPARQLADDFLPLGQHQLFAQPRLLALHHPPVADVAGDADDPAFGRERERNFLFDQGPVALAALGLAAPLPVSEQDRHRLVADAVRFERVVKRTPRPANQGFGFRVAEHQRVGAVHEDEAPVGIGDGDAVVRCLDRGDLPGETRLGGDAFVLGLLARGDVADDRGKATRGIRLGAFARPHGEREFDRDLVAGLAGGRHLDRFADQLDGPARAQPRDPGVMAVAVAVGDDHVERLADRFLGAPAKHRLGSAVPQDDPAVRVRTDESIGGGLGDQLRDALFLAHAAAFEQSHNLARHQRQDIGLASAEALARGGIDDAQGADAVPARQHQRRARVEADVRCPGDQRIGRKARVGCGIGHHHDRVAGDGVAAEAVAAAGLGRLQPVARLEPLAIGIDEADQRNRRIEAVCREPRDDVELGIGSRVEHAEVMQRGKPGSFVRQNRRQGGIGLVHGVRVRVGLPKRILAASSFMCTLCAQTGILEMKS